MTRQMLPELLAPAGNWTMLQAATQAGCDAVYFGLKGLNMRVTANNFEESELPKIVSVCHDADVRAYLVINVLVYEHERDTVHRLILAAKEAGVDAIICWDPAVIEICRQHSMPFFISTQASVANAASAQFYHDLGAEQIILARECSLQDIASIRKELPDLKLEVFIHGAMCVAVSGRCFMSQFLYGKSANRGDCIQPCRRSYRLTDPETGKELDIGNNYVMSAKDLCTIEILERIVDTGVDSLKIEGRAKTPEYVKTVVSCYRRALDHIKAGTFTDGVKKELTEELRRVFNRDFTTGFYLGAPGPNGFYDQYGPREGISKVYAGRVRNMFNKVMAAEIKLESSELKIGDTVMIQGPTTGVHTQTVTSLQINGVDIRRGEKGMRVGMQVTVQVRPQDKVFLITD